MHKRNGDICPQMFLVASSLIAKRQKQSKCPSADKWINKMYYIHIMEYYSAIKRNEVWTHATTGINLTTLC